MNRVLKYAFILFILVLVAQPALGLYISDISYTKGLWSEEVTSNGFKVIPANVNIAKTSIPNKELVKVDGREVYIPVYPLVAYPGAVVDVSMHVDTGGKLHISTDLVHCVITFNNHVVNSSEIEGSGILRITGDIPNINDIGHEVHIIKFEPSTKYKKDNYLFRAYIVTKPYVSAQKNLYDSYIEFKKIENNYVYKLLGVTDRAKDLLLDAIISFESNNYEKCAVDASNAKIIMDYGLNWVGLATLMGLIAGLVLGILVTILYVWREGLFALKSLIRTYFDAKHNSIDVSARVVKVLKSAFDYNIDPKKGGLFQKYYMYGGSWGRRAFTTIVARIKEDIERSRK